MPALVALVAAACWGSSTVCAAIAVRRGPVVAVTLWSQLSGLVVGLPLLATVPLSQLTPGDAVAGAVAGLGAGASLALLYASTRRLQPGLASALNNTTAAGIPVAVLLLLGAAATNATVAGAALCLLSILLATRVPAHPEGKVLLAASSGARVGRGNTRPSVAVAIASGAAMSVYYLAIASVPQSMGAWAALESRASSCLALCLVGTAIRGQRMRLTRQQLAPTVACGALGMGGALCYAFAATHGPVIAVVPVVALSPLVAAAVSWRVLGQRLSLLQGIGLGMAALGSVMTSLSVG